MENEETSSKKPQQKYTAHEVMYILDEDGFAEADIYITPPGTGLDSDEDSCGEEVSDRGSLNNTYRAQLAAGASVRMRHNHPDGTSAVTQVGADESGEEQEANETSERMPKQKKTSPVKGS